MQTVTFTHAGWYWFAPVVANFDDPEAPTIDARHWVFAPLFWLAEALDSVRQMIRANMDPDYEPGFEMLLAELEKPIVRKYGNA